MILFPVFSSLQDWLSVLYPGQNNFMKFQPFTVLTKTRWISSLRVALLSAWWASSSRCFPPQILPSRALATAWQSPPAWQPLCFSPSPWPPCQQTQSRTGCLEEPVQSYPRPPSMHPQNPSKKLRDRSWELSLRIAWLWWCCVLPAGCEVLWLSSDVWPWGHWRMRPLWVPCPTHEGRRQYSPLFLKHWLKHGRNRSHFHLFSN